MRFTDDQQKVIDTRSKNILVSAAAGSGKTAVLVERILSLITDPDHPVDIDELLVVTFTKAAASQMKEKLSARLLKKADEGDDDPRIIDQLTLIHNAKITTIDGFCKYVTDNYGHTIGIGSSQRIADEGEMKLLRMDTLTALITKEFEEKDPGFINFIESFASNKSETPVEQCILKLYDTAMSLPEPEKWLASVKEDLEREAAFEKEPGWMKLFEDEVGENLAYYADSLQKLLASPGLTDTYSGFFKNELDMLRALHEKHRDYEAFRDHLLHETVFARAASSKGCDPDPSLRIKALRTDYKKYITETLRQGYYSLPYEKLVETASSVNGPLIKLTELTEKYIQELRSVKASKQLMDFTDLEHYALRILRGPDGERTAAAKELSLKYAAVMVDEYQDSNYLQEAILTAVSRIDDGDSNYFMVGDVKQSIYSFREARPDLFIEKFNTYNDRDDAVRIDLHMNFRSRREVIDSVNAVFKKIMTSSIGGIEYDESAMLHFGAGQIYPDAPEPSPDETFDFRTEIIPVFYKETDLSEDADSAFKKELEARTVGTRIRTMLKREMIWDEDLGKYRRVKLKDIVILMRSMTDADVMKRVLSGMDIPSAVSGSTGYFSADEVRTVLDYISILDNPRQDIPLASVLTCPVTGLTASDLAEIRINGGSKSGRLWEDVVSYPETGKDAVLAGKIDAFLSRYRNFRDQVRFLPIHTLIWNIVHTTGYMDHLSSLPERFQKISNINMLIEKASAYEKTSYSGLFNFIRYIRDLRKYEVDYDEASVFSSEDDVVRITTIHKSKGLEYPVVFISQLSRRFNKQDLSAPVLIHPELGIASDYIDHIHRVKYPYIKKSVLKSVMEKASTGEELRVLYVAMTRAKQKLIMTGLVKNEDSLKALAERAGNGDSLPVSVIKSASCFFDLIVPAAAEFEDSDFLRFYYVAPSSLIDAEIPEKAASIGFSELVRDIDPGTVYDETINAIINERFSFVYPYRDAAVIPSKISVSELKAAAIETDDSIRKYDEETVIPYIPEFISERAGRPPGGAALGSIYHKFLELFDYRMLHVRDDGAYDEEVLKNDIGSVMSAIEGKGLMQHDELSAVKIPDIVTFLTSDIGMRMRKAALSGTLFRERPFVLSKKASLIDPDYPSDEEILVQGIIDAWFIEDDKLVLVDYKTDRLKNNDPQELVEKYRIQLDSYEEALTSLLKRKVDEKYIYSFAAGDSVRL